MVGVLGRASVDTPLCPIQPLPCRHQLPYGLFVTLSRCPPTGVSLDCTVSDWDQGHSSFFPVSQGWALRRDLAFEKRMRSKVLCRSVAARGQGRGMGWLGRRMATSGYIPPSTMARGSASPPLPSCDGQHSSCLCPLIRGMLLLC